MFQDKLVLTIDDSATIRLFLRALVGGQGAVMSEAATGGEAKALFTDGNKYDLILLDLLLPDTDGIELLKFIRQRDEDVAVVMLTGMGGIKSATAAVREGADGYIQKQDLGVGGDQTEFFYALEQAMEHRAGLAAQRQLQELKTDFYSMITHDLRNPTGSVLISLQMILDGMAGPLTDDQRELLTIAKISADKAASLINDYLDFAKIDAGFLKIEPGRVELRRLVEDAARLSILQAQSKQQTLTVSLPDDPIYAWADGDRLKQVVENLVSNAVKYTPEGGRIDVSLRTHEHEVEFEVADNGMGIAPDQLPELFAKYHRGSSRHTRKIRGTGLGLFIVKETVEAHGGSVVALSEGIPGKGTRFVVRLPLGLPARDLS